jgi:hypothetical protein
MPITGSASYEVATMCPLLYFILMHIRFFDILKQLLTMATLFCEFISSTYHGPLLLPVFSMQMACNRRNIEI